MTLGKEGYTQILCTFTAAVLLTQNMNIAPFLQFEILYCSKLLNSYFQIMSLCIYSIEDQLFRTLKLFYISFISKIAFSLSWYRKKVIVIRMDSPNPKYILSLTTLCGRAPDVLQIVQVSILYRERSFESTSRSQQFWSFTSVQEYKKIIFLYQLPGPHQEVHWYCLLPLLNGDGF